MIEIKDISGAVVFRSTCGSFGTAVFQAFTHGFDMSTLDLRGKDLRKAQFHIMFGWNQTTGKMDCTGSMIDVRDMHLLAYRAILDDVTVCDGDTAIAVLKTAPHRMALDDWPTGVFGKFVMINDVCGDADYWESAVVNGYHRAHDRDILLYRCNRDRIMEALFQQAMAAQ